ncbi:MAG: MFS transporter [Planctomycetaceae bacterium]
MTSHQPQSPRRGARIAWILLDWAASAFSTVLITLVVAYVEKIVFATGGWGVEAGVIWAWTLAAAMLASAVVVPWAAAWADRRDGHQRAVIIATCVGVGGFVALAAAPSQAQCAIVASVIAASVGFDVAQVFTGSLLRRVSGAEDADRLSAIGFAAGYAGGAIALVIATAVVAAHDRLGLDVAGGLRLAFVVTAAWWLGFSVPAAVVRFDPGEASRHAASPGRELGAFATRLWHAPPGSADHAFAAVLGGAMLALGGVQTAIGQFSSLALQQFDLDGPALVRLVLLVQAVALPGAMLVGWLSSRAGRRLATLLCFGGWIIVVVLAWFVETRQQLYGLAVVLALVLGGIQSLLRAAVAVLAPSGHAGVSFGLLQVGTKLSGFVANLAFGGLQLATGSPQSGLIALAAQLAIGWWLVRRLT